MIKEKASEIMIEAARNELKSELKEGKKKNFIFLAKNEQEPNKYRGWPCNIDRINDKDLTKIVVECRKMLNGGAPRIPDTNWKEWYIRLGFGHAENIGIPYDLSLKIIDEVKKGHKFFILDYKDVLPTTTSVDNVDVHDGMNIHREDIDISSGTHCNDMTSLTVYKSVAIAMGIYDEIELEKEEMEEESKEEESKEEESKEEESKEEEIDENEDDNSLLTDEELSITEEEEEEKEEEEEEKKEEDDNNTFIESEGEETELDISENDGEW